MKIITEKVFQGSREIMKEKTEESSVKAYPVFHFIVAKDRGRPNENIFSMYFNVGFNFL